MVYSIENLNNKNHFFALVLSLIWFSDLTYAKKINNFLVLALWLTLYAKNIKKNEKERKVVQPLLNMCACVFMSSICLVVFFFLLLNRSLDFLYVLTRGLFHNIIVLFTTWNLSSYDQNVQSASVTTGIWGVCVFFWFPFCEKGFV